MGLRLDIEEKCLWGGSGDEWGRRLGRNEFEIEQFVLWCHHKQGIKQCRWDGYAFSWENYLHEMEERS